MRWILSAKISVQLAYLLIEEIGARLVMHRVQHVILRINSSALHVIRDRVLSNGRINVSHSVLLGALCSLSKVSKDVKNVIKGAQNALAHLNIAPNVTKIICSLNLLV
jgi:hypothetical protein